MKPVKQAQAGSFESSDILILIEPLTDGSGRKVELSSSVYLQYGQNLTQIINEMLDKFEITDIRLIAQDKGALEPTIRARIETAIKRSIGTQEGTLV